jgi:nucleoid DNA-binding protein
MKPRKPIKQPITNVTYRTNSSVAFKKFKEAHPEVEISGADWRKILKVHNELFAEYILDTGDRVKLRWLGSFTIHKKKVRRFIDTKDGKQFIALPIDWQKSRKAGKRVYNFNTHSDGYRYCWRWFHMDARFILSDIWWFKPIRATSRRITEYIKMGPEQYEKYKQWSAEVPTDIKIEPNV